MSWKDFFHCSGCEAREIENAHLRGELIALRQETERVNAEARERIFQMAKDCNDRVMARSYTEYAVGIGTQEPSAPSVSRSDEAEWLIEQKHQREIEREVQETLSGLSKPDPE